MAIAAQRFKFLDNETNVPVKDFDTVFDNSVYNAPDADALYQETSDNLVSSIVGDDLISNLENSLLSFKQIDLSNVNKIVSNLLNQPELQSSLTAAMKMFNINSSNYADAVESLISIMGEKYRNSSSSLCSSDALLNAVGQSLRTSLLGRSSYLLSKTYPARSASAQCPVLSNQAIPISLPKPNNPPILSTTPSSVLKFIENENVKIINQPSSQNKENIWTSKDTYPYIKFPATTFREKEILMVNKILLYRAIYYKYEKEINPTTNPNVHTYNATDVMNLISSNQYQAAREYLVTSIAMDVELKALSQQIRITFATDPQALSIAADIDNYLILSHTQVQQEIYMYYLGRYIELMKEFVDNPIYINLIQNYQPYVIPYMSAAEQHFYIHVEQLYDFYKTNRYILNTQNPVSIYTSMVKNAPSELTQTEIDLLIDTIPSDAFSPQLNYNMPTTSDYVYAW
jgi:hypothetical protein